MADTNSTAQGLTPTPGQSAPLAKLSSSDHSAIILITTTLGLVFALISILIRYFVRLEFRHSFAYDDILVTISIIFAIVQSSTVFVAVSKGFGRTIEDVSILGLVELQKALYASDVFYIVAIWLTKCSVASLFLRLSPNRGHIITSYMILGGSTTAALVSIFIICLRCDLAQPWIYINAHCVNLLARWQIVAAFDVATEVALFGTSFYMIKDLQLSITKKTVVILAFGSRLPVIVPIIYRLHYFNIQLRSTDMTFTGVLVQVMTQTQISYAIIAATIPCLRPFMTALSTNYGAPPIAGTGSIKYKEDYSLNSLSTNSKVSKNFRRKARQDISRERSSQGSGESIIRKEEGEDVNKRTEVPQLRWDGNEHHATVGRGDGHSMESHESKQMIIETHSEWAVEYERKEEGPYPNPTALSDQDIGVVYNNGK